MHVLFFKSCESRMVFSCNVASTLYGGSRLSVYAAACTCMCSKSVLVVHTTSLIPRRPARLETGGFTPSSALAIAFPIHISELEPKNKCPRGFFPAPILRPFSGQETEPTRVSPNSRGSPLSAQIRGHFPGAKQGPRPRWACHEHFSSHMEQRRTLSDKVISPDSGSWDGKTGICADIVWGCVTMLGKLRLRKCLRGLQVLLMRLFLGMKVSMTSCRRYFRMLFLHHALNGCVDHPEPVAIIGSLSVRRCG